MNLLDVVLNQDDIYDHEDVLWGFLTEYLDKQLRFNVCVDIVNVLNGASIPEGFIDKALENASKNHSSYILSKTASQFSLKNIPKEKKRALLMVNISPDVQNIILEDASLFKDAEKPPEILEKAIRKQSCSVVENLLLKHGFFVSFIDPGLVHELLDDPLDEMALLIQRRFKAEKDYVKISMGLLDCDIKNRTVFLSHKMLFKSEKVTSVLEALSESGERIRADDLLQGKAPLFDDVLRMQNHVAFLSSSYWLQDLQSLERLVAHMPESMRADLGKDFMTRRRIEKMRIENAKKPRRVLKRRPHRGPKL